jgi:hypothetical protein
MYLSEFKLNYFRTLLKKGFNNSESVRNIIAFDSSGFTEIIMSMEDFKLIDSFTNIDHSYLLQDSINKIGRVAEGAEGKAVLGYALNKYQSKWLDSLAKARRKVYWKSMKEMEEYGN